MTPQLSATPLADSTRLADPVAVRLVVRADAPLAVNLPAELAASPGWRLVGVDSAQVVPLAGGGAEWSAVARFDPQSLGLNPLTFRPVGVVAGVGAVPESHTFPAVAVRVASSLGGDRALLRGPAGPESPTLRPGGPAGVWLVTPLLLGLTLLAATRRRRRAGPGAPADWVALAAGPLADPEFAARLAGALRAWAGGERETTPELAARYAADPRGAAAVVLLAACDLARFAPRGFPPGARDALARSAAGLLAESPPRRLPRPAEPLYPRP